MAWASTCRGVSVGLDCYRVEGRMWERDWRDCTGVLSDRITRVDRAKMTSNFIAPNSFHALFFLVVGEEI